MIVFTGINGLISYRLTQNAKDYAESDLSLKVREIDCSAIKRGLISCVVLPYDEEPKTLWCNVDKGCSTNYYYFYPEKLLSHQE